MSKRAESELKLELVNVGHGDALVIQRIPKNGEPSTILIDGGPSAGAASVKATLAKIGVSELDLVVLTHCDADHVDGLLGYVKDKDTLPIRRYWGPCIPAFRRHQWLFAPRVFGGIDKAQELQDLLPPTCAVSWPVEGATWTSPDNGLLIRVISPAARLIERLLVADDSTSLFLEQPTPIGWLLADSQEDDDDDDLLSGLRLAIATGEITPDVIPPRPPIPDPPSQEDMKREAFSNGVDPEFFGNSVLNDTSIVLLVEARIGVVTRRILLTGDLENFTYLMARYPMGLSCDIVKVPHHGSRSYVDRDIAYDAVWQWMRPRAALVSANGKHNLPRSEFRDAALRYGTTLFCTSRRQREIISGQMNETCCHTQFGCRSEANVALSVTASGIEADQTACARGNLTGVMPVIEVRQHVVEPSPILSTMAETEIRKHTDWAVRWLRGILTDRQQRPSDAELPPVALNVMKQAAVGAGRVGASVEMETILERAARSGRIWMPPRRHRGDERTVWVMPQVNDIADFKAWIDNFAVIQLAIEDRHAPSAPEELLYAADTDWIATRFSERFSYPKQMFDPAIWPIITAHLLKTRTLTIRSMPTYPSPEASTIIALFKETSLEDAHEVLVARLEALPDFQEIRDYIDAIERKFRIGLPVPASPLVLSQIVTPLWLKRELLPSGLVDDRYSQTFPLLGTYDGVDQVRKWINDSYEERPDPFEDQLVRSVVASFILSGYEVIRRPKPGR
ncbi:ComEC/Rec2 family competence protein [Agrobacterium vitis]|uniref:ComEC/Rec2 family competence protein n=1 Tax=Agrobacterium vitis TaxID=373 RepID=UPI002034DFC7|nr:MBL fold metallo-hydrolase [Agrobacterium vitis]MCM2453440.1 MBL fold metallo-hydrolase [Agrobacterium vitis]